MDDDTVDEELRFSSRLNDHDACELMTSFNDDDYLGCGTFGSARVCYHPELGKVVVKCFSLTGAKAVIEKRIRNVKREANILSRLTENDYIVQVRGVASWSNNVCIILEYLNGGNLDTYLKNETVPNISWSTRLKFAFQLDSALEYLHNFAPGKEVCHEDVKPDNVLLTKTLDIKLADFGAAKIIRATGLQTTTMEAPPTQQHTPAYTSPEFLRNPCQATRTPATDMYSYSMVLFEIITRKSVYEDCGLRNDCLLLLIISTERKLRPNICLVEDVEKKIANPDDKKIFQLLKDIMTVCWDEEPKRRHTSRQVANIFEEFKDTHNIHSNAAPIFVTKSQSATPGMRVGLHTFESPFRDSNARSSRILESLKGSSIFPVDADGASVELVQSTRRKTSRINRMFRSVLPTRWIQGRKHSSYHFIVKLELSAGHDNGYTLFYSFKESFARRELFHISITPTSEHKKAEGLIQLLDFSINDSTSKQVFGRGKARQVLNEAFPTAKRLKLSNHRILVDFQQPDERSCADFALNSKPWQYPSIAMLNENGLLLKLWKKKLPTESYHGTLIGSQQRELEDFAEIAACFFGRESLVWLRFGVSSNNQNRNSELMLLP